MSAVTYEGRVERGRIILKDAPALPEGAHVYVVVTAQEATVHEPWVRELYDLFAPAREEAASQGEEEVNADIDAAMAAVRGKRA